MSEELLQLDREIRSCKRCGEALERHPENPPNIMRGVAPKPILSDPMQAPVMLIGQAPGLTEYQTGKPFSGPAGGGIRRLFADCGLPHSDFDRIVYQTSAVKCFPGRRRNKDRWEDRPPCGAMRRFCSAFLTRQINAIRPSLIVTLGGVAAEVFDRIRRLPRRKLSQVHGTLETWEGIAILYLAHTSGTSRFSNEPANRAKQERAKAILAQELNRLKSPDGAWS